MERRKQTRRDANFDVRLFDGDTDSFILQVANYSNDGIYLLSGGNPLPSLGSVVQVKLNQQLPRKTEPPLLEMVVKRIDSEGIGLQNLQPSH